MLARPYIDANTKFSPIISHDSFGLSMDLSGKTRPKICQFGLMPDVSQGLIRARFTYIKRIE
jgi:hypothetical protein